MISLELVWDRLWLFLWLGMFLVLELVAVAFGRPTLSSRVRDWFSLRERKRLWLVRRTVFVVFWLTLGIAHFMLGVGALWTVILPGAPFVAVIVYAIWFEKEIP